MNQELRIPVVKKLHNSLFMIHDSILNREAELFDQFKKYIMPLSAPDVDAIAVTYGPGLAPALWVGVNFAKALAILWEKPLIPINHMAGHLYSALLQKENGRLVSHEIKFPALALLVSGGHTELVLVNGLGTHKIIGETLDDAAGEAFDKVARMLELGYPGGPAIAKEALSAKDTKINLPRPMLYSKDFNFSFSGLKTAVLYLIRDISKITSIKKLSPAIAKEFQDAVVEVLVTKTMRAAKRYTIKTLLLGGGVAANTQLRKILTKAVVKELPRTKLFLPDPVLTGDNALMIALAAYVAGKKKAPIKIRAEANLRLR